MYKRLCCTAVFIILFSFLCPALAFSVTGRDVMVMVDERNDGDNRTAVTEMTLVNRRGEKRIREVLSLSIDMGKDTKKMMFFRKPDDVKGTSFLSWEYDNPEKDDDKWLYMPALRKTRRISGESENEYFMGTDFTYDDLGDRNIDEDTHKLLGEEKKNGFDCWVVESVPVDENSYYRKKISWIRKDALVASESKYFDREGLLKTFTAVSLELINGIWTSTEIKMENHRDNHSTIIKILKMEYNTEMDESVFTVSSMARGLIR